MPRLPSARAQQAQVGAARDELLDQLQIGRVVLDIQQGAQLGVAVGTCGCAQRRAVRLRARRAAVRSSGSNSIQNTLPSPTVLSTPMAPPISSTSRLRHHQADAGAFLGAGLLVRDG